MTNMADIDVEIDAWLARLESGEEKLTDWQREQLQRLLNIEHEMTSDSNTKRS